MTPRSAGDPATSPTRPGDRLDSAATRRQFLGRTAVGLGAGWVAPVVVTSITSSAGAVSIIGCRVEFDATCTEQAPDTATSACEPATWTTSADCVGSPVTCSVDGATGVVTLSSATCMIVAAIAEDAGPAGPGCVTPGEAMPATSITLAPKTSNSIVIARAIVAC